MQPFVEAGLLHLLDLAHYTWNAEVVPARQRTALAILIVALAAHQADLVAQLGQRRLAQLCEVDIYFRKLKILFIVLLT